ncbi:unnamed protein product [Leptidea sinapis]|uniref:ornithine decarboxylase n=1 Tax=Leptidea sinapis TaxID=189913 RepID=A0A5E4QZ74_9NEOP|nr:unnamed protein product [Leptidea sinapis]
MKIVDEECVYVMEGEWSPRSVIREIVDSGDQEDPFYVMDLGVVVDRYQHWKEMMPRVEPFYAVKCNDDRILVRTLAALGAGFDCASKAEIQLVTSIGVKPERIIFANPAKMASHIRYAGAVGAKLMTFDSQTELHKIKKYCPDARLVVRIRCDAAAAQCPLGIKFGCRGRVVPRRLGRQRVRGVRARHRARQQLVRVGRAARRAHELARHRRRLLGTHRRLAARGVESDQLGAATVWPKRGARHRGAGPLLRRRCVHARCVRALHQTAAKRTHAKLTPCTSSTTAF